MNFLGSGLTVLLPVLPLCFPASIMTDTHPRCYLSTQSCQSEGPSHWPEAQSTKLSMNLVLLFSSYGRELDMYVITTVEENDTKKTRVSLHDLFFICHEVLIILPMRKLKCLSNFSSKAHKTGSVLE